MSYVVRCLDSIIPLLVIAEISRLWLISVSEQASLSYLVKNPEDRFSRDEAHIIQTMYSRKYNVAKKLPHVFTAEFYGCYKIFHLLIQQKQVITLKIYFIIAISACLMWFGGGLCVPKAMQIVWIHVSHVMRNLFVHMQTIKAQISLHICAVWLAPLLFAA